MVFVDASTLEKSEEATALGQIIVVNATFDNSEYFRSFRRYRLTNVEFIEKVKKIIKRK